MTVLLTVVGVVMWSTHRLYTVYGSTRHRLNDVTPLIYANGFGPAGLANEDRNVWVEFNSLARQYQCQVNLGQGFPNFVLSEHVPKMLAEVVMEGNKFLQYTPERGHFRLRKAVATLHSQLLNRPLDYQTDVLCTHGAYESLQCVFLSLLNAGDEVILVEPFYECYLPMACSAEAVPVFVPLRPCVHQPTSSKDWKLDYKELESKFSNKTKMIVINTPNNPLGKVYSHDELQMIAELCIKHDVICVTDEVYEWLVYPGVQHVRMASLPGMWERTIAISSASKSFGVTGWRVGWSVGPKELIDCLMVSHQNGDCVCNTPAQEAIARCLELEIERFQQPESLFCIQQNLLLKKRDMLIDILKQAGFRACVPEGSYFILADWTNVVSEEEIEDGSNDTPDFKFAKWLVKTLRISAIPPSAFYHENKHIAGKYVRFCCFKTEDVLTRTAQIFQEFVNSRHTPKH